MRTSPLLTASLGNPKSSFVDFLNLTISNIMLVNVLLFRRFFRRLFSDELFYTSCFSSLQTNFLCPNNRFYNSFALMVSTAISIYVLGKINYLCRLSLSSYCLWFTHLHDNTRMTLIFFYPFFKFPEFFWCRLFIIIQKICILSLTRPSI